MNPATAFDLDRSYKWMQGRAQPRSARVYEDWATLLGTATPIAHLQSCSLDEFLDLVCDHHEVSRDALAARAGLVVGAPSKPPGLGGTSPSPGPHLIGAYACYSHAWSPYFEGRIIRGSLLIEPATGGAPALAATYSEADAFGPLRLRGPVGITGRAIHIELWDATARTWLEMCLFLPGTLANVLAGVMCGATILDVDPQPAATRIVMIRVPDAGDSRLEASNRYLDATAPLSSDLVALGVPVTAAGELDALLEGFLAADRPSSYIKLAADDYSRLTLVIDRLFIDGGIVPRSRTDALQAAS